MYRLDVSHRVQSQALKIIEAVVESEKRHRKPQQLAEFAKEILLPILQTILRDYKQRRRKLGNTVLADIFITIGTHGNE